ncbi:MULTISPECIES: hypothetical protein [Chryseobacterium]|jgi:hypothetical protein|nr:hypothetical protein [Chryseobacterium lathyri]
MQCTGFGILNTSRINTDDAHSSTGSDKNRTPLFFSGQQRISRETPAGQLLLECRVKIKPNRRNIEADIPKY